MIKDFSYFFRKRTLYFDDNKTKRSDLLTFSSPLKRITSGTLNMLNICVAQDACM